MIDIFRQNVSLSPPQIPDLSGWWKNGDWTAESERVSQWNDSGGNARHLLQATGANQPIEATWTGENYAKFNFFNSAANSLSQANTAAMQITTGNVGFALRLAVNDLAGGGVNQSVITKGSSTTARSYGVGIPTASGAVQFWITADGATQTTVTSSVTLPAAGYADFQKFWLGIFWDNANGQCYFYTAPDSATIPTGAGWTQLGATQALATTTLFSDTSAIRFGRYIGATQFTGKVFRGLLYTGASTDNTPTGCATTVCDFDASRGSDLSATTLDPITGQTWAVPADGALKTTIISSPCIIGDAAAYFMRAAYVQAQPCTRFFLVKKPAWISGNYTTDGVGANSAAIIATTATPSRSMNAGTAGQNENAAPTISAYHVWAMVWNGASSKFIVDATTASGGNPGTTTTGGLTIYADGGAAPATFGGGHFKEIVEYNRVLTDAETSTVLRYLARKGNSGVIV
jgi:hypothetical protein